MQRIDERHLDYPFAGNRMQCDLLGDEGVEIGQCCHFPVWPSPDLAEKVG